MIRLVAIDLDGTLLNSELRVTPDTAQTIRRYAAQGVLFTFCSGRCLVELGAVGELVSGFRYAILCNGAYALDLRSNELLHEAALTPAQTLEMYCAGEGLDRMAELSFCDRVIAERQAVVQLERYGLGGPLTHTVRTTREQVDDLGRWLRENRQNVGKINMFFPTRAERDRAIARYAPYPFAYCHQLENNFEINSPDASKGSALAALAARLGIRKDEVMAIGDNNNDLPMLEYAGTAVAMGNAIEKIKEQADFVTRSNDQDGVAHALRQLLG